MSGEAHLRGLTWAAQLQVNWRADVSQRWRADVSDLPDPGIKLMTSRADSRDSDIY